MTVKELIKHLEKYPNQEAEVNFIANLVDADNDAFDKEKLDVEFMQQDIEDCPIYDIVVFDRLLQKEKKQENSLHSLLDDNGIINIKLDSFSYHSNIVVTDNDNNVLREIQVGGRFHDSENIINTLGTIL